MKILHIVTSINLGGAENHLYSLVSKQIDELHEVMVVYLKGDHYWASQYLKIGCKLVCLNIPRYFFLYRSFLFKEICINFGAHLIHAHMPPAELVVLINKIFFLKIRKIPFVISKHNAEPFAPCPGHQILFKLSMYFCDGVICISKSVFSYNQKNTVPSTVVYYGIDRLKIRDSISVDLSIVSDQFVIGTVARLTSQKSLPTLLNAFKLFLDRYPESVLVIIGVGELEFSLKRLALNLGIDSKVVWAGKRSDALGVMKRFNIFVLPSLYEGLGLVLLEALSLKIPIVASKIDAALEILEEGKFGLLFETRNHKDLYQKLLLIKEKKYHVNWDECEKMLEEKFSIHSMYLKTQDFYLQAISCKALKVS